MTESCLQGTFALSSRTKPSWRKWFYLVVRPQYLNLHLIHAYSVVGFSLCDKEYRLLLVNVLSYFLPTSKLFIGAFLTVFGLFMTTDFSLWEYAEVIEKTILWGLRTKTLKSSNEPLKKRIFSCLIFLTVLGSIGNGGKAQNSSTAYEWECAPLFLRVQNHLWTSIFFYNLCIYWMPRKYGTNATLFMAKCNLAIEVVYWSRFHGLPCHV